MSLRRTALQRRTELRRGGPLPRRVATRRARAARTIAGQQRSTGPDSATRATVAFRAGYHCEVCGAALALLATGAAVWIAPHSFHHRRPRGMGGTRRPETNSPVNLLLLCGTGTTGCHGDVERDRTAALDRGLLVAQALDPADVVVELRHGRFLLTHDGIYLAVA